jgi:hypothetical protein
MNCQFCEHAIDEHNSHNGCVHVKRVKNKDLVCPCLKKPSEIVATAEELLKKMASLLQEIYDEGHGGEFRGSINLLLVQYNANQPK